MDNYQDSDGVLMTYAFNDLYTVSSPQEFAAFNSTESGTAAIRHFCLNENVMATEAELGQNIGMLGYFVADVELAGPYITLPEATAVANGDPYYFGYLSSNTFNRGFPGYVRQFNTNYLALPALTSVRQDDLIVDKEGLTNKNLVVRTITPTGPDAEHGIWLAVINIGLEEVYGAEVTLPTGNSTDLVLDGVSLVDESLPDGELNDLRKLVVNLYPGQLKTYRIVASDYQIKPKS